MDTGFCIASVTGQGMGADAAWDGKIDIEEYVERFMLGNGANAGRLKVRSFTEHDSWEIDELVKRSYADVFSGRRGIGSFAMPIDVNGSNSQGV